MEKKLKGKKLSKKNRYDLDEERLSSTDEFGNRVYIYPEDVKGKWKTRRFLVYWILVILYLVLPWIYINDRPSLMLNLSKREFTFLGQTIYGVEPILMFLLLISGLFFIAFLVSRFGRVWCGWGCPQTVFIQSIFLKIESFIEGRARDRIALDDAPWTLSKIAKRITKWSLFILVSSHIAHTFIGYFVGPRELFYMTIQSPSLHWEAFVITNFLTALFLIDFGWFREQFCIIACPYGRIQSVLMDENSQVVSYDSKRGEPRRGTDGVNKDNEGDCVNCYSCVKVCPTGIDIRRGVQLECIACTQCIDACDDIMRKLNKPEGLIKYTNEIELKGIDKKNNLRPYIYILGTIIFISAFVYFLGQSTKPSLIFLRGKGAPYLVSNQKNENESINYITNKFTLVLKHQGGVNYKIELKIKDETLKNKVNIQVSEYPISLDKAEKKVFIFFKFSKGILINGSLNLELDVVDFESKKIITSKEVNLVGPIQ